MKGSLNITLRIVAVIFFNFICYLTIGLPLAVLPLYVHRGLGFGEVLAGLAISFQYLATFASRARAGRTSDIQGPKVAVLRGLFACGISGAFLIAAGFFAETRMLSFSLILISRLSLGIGESFVATGATMWGIGRVGAAHTARVISWNGIATFSALALGAPLGIMLEHRFGFSAVGVSMLLAAWLAVPLAKFKPAIIPEPGIPIPISRVLRSVFPCGMGLALGTIGFASIATFITLYYAGHAWLHADLALSAFGLCFVTTRLFFGNTIYRFGGYKVSLVCFAVEGLGLTGLGLASNVEQAFLACVITGIGFALIFPALGVEAVSRVAGNSRGAALGLYSVFTDLALAITGPVGGFLAQTFGFSAVFFFAGLASLSAFGLVAAILYSFSRREKR